MIIDIKIPTPGESITEVEIAQWLVDDGAIVEKNQEIAEIESDKATLMLTAEESGQISIKYPIAEPIKVGSIACTIDTEKAGSAINQTQEEQTEKKQSEEPIQSTSETNTTEKHKTEKTVFGDVKATPLAKKMMENHQVTVDDILNGISRLNKNAVEQGLQGMKQPIKQTSTSVLFEERKEERKKMSSIRRKISERLVQVKNETAMLTTFNEVDMSAVMDMRNTYQKKFMHTHGTKLGFMSFFTKAAALALKSFPEVNAMIDKQEIIQFNFADIGIAVQTPKGLMVPIIRNAHQKLLPDLEKEIAATANKARNGKITIEELQGGTFSITNGGVFGSMLSTPIINPPQAAILGMHNIVERPVAIKGKVTIRPIMYLALSYDHRLIDGKASVGFLKTIKELIEEPVQLLLGENSTEKLLGI